MTATSAVRYGWVIVAVGVLSIAVHAAVGYSNALFLVPITEDMGWSRTVVSASLSVFALGNGLWVAVVGFLVHAWGPRRLLTVAALVLMGGLLLISRIQNPLLLSAAMLLPVGFGSAGVGGLANYTAIQPWFRERRGSALALVATGNSVGVLLMPAIQSSILNLGWRGAYQVMAGIALALAPLHLLTQRQPPAEQRWEAEAGAGEDGAPGILGILRSRNFWLVFLGLATSASAGSLIMAHHVAFLTDHGFGPSSIATALRIVGVAGLAGRIGLGWLSDRLGTIPVLALVIASMMAAIGFLASAGQTGTMPSLCLFAIAFGASLDVAPILFTRLTGDIVGGQAFSRVMGLAYIGGSLGVTIGPIVAGAAYDATGSYASSFVVAAVALLLSLACSWLLRPAAARAAP